MVSPHQRSSADAGEEFARIVPDLDRITEVSRLLGDPQLTYPTIHVTGTNGKTTTARLLEALACAQGLTTGLYTSPHLDSVCERMAVCEVDITPEEFGEQYEHLLPFLQIVDAQGEVVSYFETVTALAYLWFSDYPVSLGVFEVGMGGLWDATNLISGDVAVITPIALDHPELGPTLADKAREKGGIIKPGKVAVVREQPDEVLEVLTARCEEVGATMLLEERDWSLEEGLLAVGGQAIAVRGIHGRYDDVLLTLFGDHAGRNAAAANVAFEAFLDGPVPEEPLREAYASAASPGRLEVAARHPLVILDGAHNPAGAAALAEALEDVFAYDRLHVVLACSADKDIEGIIAPLAALDPIIYASDYTGYRSMPADELAGHCEALGLLPAVIPGIEQALAAAAAAAEEADCILATGSLYTVAEARRALTP